MLSNSYTVEHFKSIANDVNRNPHPVYLQLLQIEKNKEQLSEDAYLWLLYRKAHAENLLYFHKKFDQTVDFAQKLITPDTDIEIQASFNMYAGIAAQRRGEFSKSVSLTELAMVQAKEANLNIVYTQAKHELGYTRSLTQLYETSLADLQEAYVEAYALNDNFLIAVINETYGAVYGYMMEYEKSIEYYTKALDTYERLGYKPYVAEAIYGLASTFRYWKKYDLAAEKFNLYLNRISYTPNKEISYFGAYGLGMTYAEKGDCEKAIPVIDKALTLNGQVDYDAELYKRKANCLIKEGKFAEAEANIEAAEGIFATMPELTGTKWTLENLKLRGLLHAGRGEYEVAFHTINQYYTAHMEHLIDNSTQQLIRVRAAMEIERQNIEMSLLQQRNKVQQLQLSEQASSNRLQVYFAVGAVLLSAIITVFAFMQYRSKQKILALSITDPLSGIYNRRYIFDYLDRITSNNESKQGDLSILLFDIDDFKRVNDLYGHPFGDEVICRVSQVAQQTLRGGDVVGRIGGEEFLCILPRADVEQALVIAERLKEAVSSSLFTTELGEQVTITISVGVSTYGEAAVDRSAMYLQSDQALYLAKQQGKNKVVVFDDNP
ncbi:diguanylate cyclase [Thalassotalea euphylliae]|uniref:tetratricopeptide repeat-containing diguanylate cyclase n=1 Tax=Thalassotalea euphylliae TaxID=1655234 RepID=UPI003643212B